MKNKQELPYAEHLAQKILLNDLLQVMQEDDQGRIPGIERDEADLFKILSKCFKIDNKIFSEAVNTYADVKEAKNQNVDKLFTYDTNKKIFSNIFYDKESNELYRRWNSLMNITTDISKEITPETTSLTGKTILDAVEYANNLELNHPNLKRPILENKALTPEEVLALMTLYEEGDYGSWFGIPNDDTYLTGSKRPLDTLLPHIADFKRYIYNGKMMRGGKRSTKFISRDIEFNPSGIENTTLSTSLYKILVSRAAYSSQKSITNSIDNKSKHRLMFTKNNIKTLFFNTVVPIEAPNSIDAFLGEEWIQQEEERLGNRVIEVDTILQDTFTKAIEDEKYTSDKFLKLKEMNYVARLVAAYNQIMEDGIFSHNERAMFDRALEYAGVRNPLTRDYLLGVRRSSDGNVIEQNPTNMEKLFSSRLMREALFIDE